MFYCSSKIVTYRLMILLLWTILYLLLLSSISQFITCGSSGFHENDNLFFTNLFFSQSTTIFIVYQKVLVVESLGDPSAFSSFNMTSFISKLGPSSINSLFFSSEDIVSKSNKTLFQNMVCPLDAFCRRTPLGMFYNVKYHFCSNFLVCSYFDCSSGQRCSRKSFLKVSKIIVEPQTRLQNRLTPASGDRLQVQIAYMIYNMLMETCQNLQSMEQDCK